MRFKSFFVLLLLFNPVLTLSGLLLQAKDLESSKLEVPKLNQ